LIVIVALLVWLLVVLAITSHGWAGMDNLSSRRAGSSSYSLAENIKRVRTNGVSLLDKISQGFIVSHPIGIISVIKFGHVGIFTPSAT
jgi:hypothetical protein